MMLNLLLEPSARLAAAEQLLDRLHDVPSLTDDRLDSLMREKGAEKLLLLDVRTPEEFMVSHLEGAVRIEPDTTAEVFDKLFPDEIANRTIVAYCSIGERSAVLLERVIGLCREKGAESAVNLRGGIFRWYTDGRPVVDENGPTDRIHPYSALWGMLIGQRGSNP